MEKIGYIGKDAFTTGVQAASFLVLVWEIEKPCFITWRAVEAPALLFIEVVDVQQLCNG